MDGSFFERLSSGQTKQQNTGPAKETPGDIRDEVHERVNAYFERLFQETLVSDASDSEQSSHRSRLLDPIEDMLGLDVLSASLEEREQIGTEMVATLKQIAERCQRDQIDRKTSQRFFQKVTEIFFSHSDAFEAFSFQDRIRFMRATEELDPLDPLFDRAYAAVAYFFAFTTSAEEIQTLLQDKQNSPGDRMGFWHYLRLAALSQDVSSPQARARILQTLSAMKDEDLSYFEACQRDIILADIEQLDEDNHPIPTSGQKERQAKNTLLLDTMTLSTRLKIDEKGCTSDFLYPLSRDAVASVNKRGSLQGMALYDKDDQALIKLEPTKVFLEKGAPQKQISAEDATELLRELHRPLIKERIEQEAGIKLVDLSLREQIQLLNYLASEDAQTTKRALAVIRAHGIACARSFLSCEHGQKLGGTIIKIAERLEPASANAIFKKYAEIVDVTEVSTQELLNDFYAEDKEHPFERQRLNEELLVRAKSILQVFAEQIDEPSISTSIKSVLTHLDRFQKDTVFFASMFKTAAKRKDIDFKELKGVSFEKKVPAELTVEEKQQMLDVLDENWKTQKPSVASWVRAGFETKIDQNNQNTQFFLLKKRGHVIAFMRFDERPDLGEAVLYAGSLNVSPELRGSALGETVLRKTVDQLAKDHVIYADFFPEVVAGTMYVEQMGWIITGVEEVVVNQEGKTEKRFLMKRDDAVNTRYAARQSVTKQAIIKDQKSPLEARGWDVRSFILPKQTSDLIKTIEQASASGLVATRYFADDQDQAKFYVVLEPASSQADASRAAA